MALKRRLALLGIGLSVVGIIPAAGPVYLGIIREEIHAHSRLGDYGLQAITFAGAVVVITGLYLVILSRSSDFGPPLGINETIAPEIQSDGKARPGSSP